MKTYSTYVSDVLDIDKTIKQHGNKILLIATGALMSTTAIQQGEAICGIAHAVAIEN